MFHSAFLVLGVLAAVTGLALTFLSQRYWFARAWRFAGRLRRPGWRLGIRAAVIALLAATALIALGGIVANLRGTISRGSPLNAFFGLWLSSSVFAYLFVKLVAGADWLWQRLRRTFSVSPDALPSPAAASETIDHSRRYFFQAAGFLAGAVPFASVVYGFAGERLRFQVREVEIPVGNLPPTLDGLRITQLSDIHVGSYMPVEQVRRAVSMANELGGDLAVVTGDFLTGRTDPLEECIAEISRLRAPLGIWGCNGNHEIYARAEAEAARLFRLHGMKLLRHENAELRWQGTAFNLIGVDYQRQRAADGRGLPMLPGVKRLIRRDVPNILLSHNPNSFPRAAELGIELSLAGHTHGGQVRVEILDHRWSPAEFLTPYVAGLYKRPLLSPASLNDAEIEALPQASSPQHPAASSAIYVNRGLGTIGAPVRLGVPPEITLITLRRVAEV
jgi:predicted MPP superfamily phosphohydrolase